jgi:hypothetical protein
MVALAMIGRGDGRARTSASSVEPLRPLSANLIVIARRLIVPEGLMRVARLRKAYVAIGARGVANPWLRVRRSPRRRPGTKCLEWRKKKRSVPEGQDD